MQFSIVSVLVNTLTGHLTSKLLWPTIYTNIKKLQEEEKKTKQKKKNMHAAEGEGQKKKKIQKPKPTKKS